MSAGRPVDVAVGILIRPDGRFLLAQRPAGKPYAGYWEFPGGKLEAGESVAQALRRELHEELGLEVGGVCPWVTREHVYPHAHVRLHFCRVYDWTGTAHGREGQAFGFFTLECLPEGPLLDGALPVMPWLGLPERCLLLPAARMPEVRADTLALEPAGSDRGRSWWREVNAMPPRRGCRVHGRDSARSAVADGAHFLIVEERDSALLEESPVPVYLLIGAATPDLALARARGAHGLAACAAD